MSGLTVDRFDEFVDAVTSGRQQPFPWQRRLLRMLAHGDEPGRWPDLLALPTGTGKTSTIDVAIYALAMGLPIPRRMFFVVDRRVIVQQAALHARHLADQLANPNGILREVADGLSATGAMVAVGDGGRDAELIPLRVAELRGGIEQDRAWALRPDQPCVIATTVDQLGSRLLFRGYGVTNRMLPIHAGLVGNDSLILLDEVHLARPFAALLRRLRNRFMRPANGLEWQVVELSATPPSEPGSLSRFDLADDDRSHPVLRRRLDAAKPTIVVRIRPAADPIQARASLVCACVEQTLEALRDDRVRTAAVVVNRVRSAAMIARALRAGGVDAVLVTGRMRGLDRHEVLDRLNERARAGRTRSATDRPFVAVATQTIEAGADFDFDLLVTECASIDALVQRFGRIDRLGDLRDHLRTLGAESTSPRPSVVIGWDRMIGSDDPVYGAAIGHTWAWLRDREVDFGTNALQQDTLDAALSTPARAHPVLLRSHLDRWVRTAPKPDADPDISPFLHGFDSAADPEVEIVWRGDITISMLRAATQFGNSTQRNADEQMLVDLLVAVPPLAGESVSVPLSQARSWLRWEEGSIPADHVDAELADIEGARAPVVLGGAGYRPAILWRSDTSVVTSDLRQVRPGDTLVVPSTYGGLAEGTWDPTDVAPVRDVAAAAHLAVGQLTLRLNPSVLPPYDVIGPTEKRTAGCRRALLLTAQDEEQGSLDLADAAPGETAQVLALPRLPTPAYVVAQDVESLDAVSRWLIDATPLLDLPPRAESALAEWTQRGAANCISTVGSEWGPVYSLSVAMPEPVEGLVSMRVDIDSEPWRSSNVGTPYELDAHLADVERWARALADACLLPPELTTAVAVAGALHDLGKADPRFQAMVREGDLPLGAPLLAKSAIPARDRARSDRARALAGYPARQRHELASLALLRRNGVEIGTADDDLVAHLVSSHHGHCRPFSSPQVDETPVDIAYNGDLGELSVRSDHRLGTVGSDIGPRFCSVIERYGYHRLAYLETLLRLADHGASRNITAPGTDSTSAHRVRPLRLNPVTGRCRESRLLDHKFDLTALRADSAHGFLAAIGVVEALYRVGLSVGLSWTSELLPHAVLHGVPGFDEAVAAILHDRDRRLHDVVLGYPAGVPFETLSRSGEEFAAWFEHVAAQPDDHPDLDLFCGLLIQGGKTANGNSKPTHFDLTAGQAKFLRIVRSIAGALDENALAEAMIGPWLYRSDLSTLRYEATGERLQALRGVPPSLEPIKGVPGADWLAFLAVSFYPLALRPGRDRDRVITPACDANWNRSAFRWPVWTQPLDRPTIAALVTHPDLVGEEPSRRHTSPTELGAHAVSQVWQSSLVRSQQGYGSFGPAKSIARASR